VLFLDKGCGSRIAAAKTCSKLALLRTSFNASVKVGELDRGNNNYPIDGQAYIHELCHALQIANFWFVPGWICEGIGAQMQGTSAYDFGRAVPPYSSFNIEAQATIVDHWFGQYAAGWTSIADLNAKLNSPAATSDAYFVYTANNIRMKQG
jgi:hypothetical protein